MSSRFVHVVACIRTSLLFKTKYFSVLCICHSCFIQLSVDRCANIWVPAFSFGGYIPRSEIAGSHDNFMLDFLRLGIFCIYYLEQKRCWDVPWGILRCACRTAPPSVPKLVQRPTRQLHKSKGLLLRPLGSLLPAFPPVTGDRLPEQEKVIPKILVCKPEQGTIWFKTVSLLFCYGYVSECDTWLTSTPPPPPSAGRAKAGTLGRVNPSRTSIKHLLKAAHVSAALPPSSKLAEKLPVTWWHQLFRNWQTLQSLIITNNGSTSSIPHLSRQSGWVLDIPRKASSRITHKENPALWGWPSPSSPVPIGKFQEEIRSHQKPNSLFFWCCF